MISGTLAADAIKSGHALPFVSSGLAFTQCEIIRRVQGETLCREFLTARDMASGSRRDELSELIVRVTTERPPLRLSAATLLFDRPLVMGIVNVTPDSFSGDGLAGDVTAAIARGRQHVEEGADVLDIGGESTRPGADFVDPDEECDRILPVISALKDLGVPISVDTRRAKVMTVATAAGATIINDVSALTGDPHSLDVAAAAGAAVVLNHMRGSPRDMQDNPHYADVVLDVYDELAARIEAAVAAGISREHLIVDPGLGFGKTAAHNFQLLSSLALYQGLGCPVLIGASRKSFLGAISGGGTPAERLPGSLSAAIAAVQQGANIVRVHDVAPTRQALKTLSAIDGGN
ncbi:MAG TPA: dihydropteroate synthase [Sneathiellales bacterium]|nr:dihydropteroate synthase [Sneathiellales bacterium]